MTPSLTVYSRAIKTVVWIITIILTAFISLYFYRYFFSQKPTLEQQIPISIITDMNLIKTDRNGAMAYRSLSSKAYHYSTRDRTEFTSPKGYYYPKQQPYWRTTADHGQTLNGDEILHLLGHVYMHQDAGKNNHELTLTTSKATLYPQKQIAKNNVFVKIEEPDMVVTSIGFHANMKQGKVVLLSQVHGRFINNKQQTETSR